MTRSEEAKELKRQGLKPEEIAEKMNIKQTTVYCYLSQSDEARKRYQIKKYGVKVRSIIREELTSFGLPMDWEDELMKMFTAYHYSRSPPQGFDARLDIQSLILLLCRRYRIPSPRRLEVLTYQGRGDKRSQTGYVDALQVLDGVTPSKSTDYVKHFVEAHNLGEDEIPCAEKLLEKVPLANRQGMNPRVLASAILFEMHRPENPQAKSVYTQRYIADQLEVTEVSLRNAWKKFFAEGKDVRGLGASRISGYVLAKRIDNLEEELSKLRSMTKS